MVLCGMYLLIPTVTFYSPPFYTEVITYHNMVGVAVAMVIHTMHEKSCIDLRNAR